MTNQTETVLVALRACRENVERRNDGSVWADIYLDNARPDGMSIYTFRACLSELSKLGLYEVMDGKHFGLVKLAP